MRIAIVLLALFILAFLVPSVAAFDMLSPTNTTYTSNVLDLHVSYRSLPNPFNTTYTYSVDGVYQGPIPTTIIPVPSPPIMGLIDGQLTLILTNGGHHVTVYALHFTPMGSFVEESTVYFTVDDPNPKPVPSPSPTPSPTPQATRTLDPTPSASPSTQPTPSTSASPSPTASSETIMPTPTPIYPSLLVPEFTVSLNETTIELKIKNQPFDKNNIYHYSFVYNVRIKTSDEDWIDLYDPEDGYPPQSDSDYTVLSYVLGESAYYPSAEYPLSPSTRVGIIPASGQLEFQVQAMVGYRDRGAYSDGIMPYVFKGVTSGWSIPQTVTINSTISSPSSSSSPSPSASISPTPLTTLSPFPTQQTQPGETQTSPLSYAIAAIALVATVFVAGILFTRLRYEKSNVN